MAVIVAIATLIAVDSRWSLLIFSYGQHGCVVAAAAASLVAVRIQPSLVRLFRKCSCFADRCWYTAIMIDTAVS